MEYVSSTQKGNKFINEDAVTFKEYPNGLILAAISDGMGGHSFGNIASETVISACVDFWNNRYNIKENIIKDLIAQAFDFMADEFELKSQNLPSEMGATLCFIIIYNDTVYCAHCGDSRIYLFDNEGCNVYWSKDHIEYKNGRRVINNAFFSCHCEEIVPEINIFSKEKVSKIFLCSDGVCNYIPAGRLFQLITTKKSLQDTSDEVKMLCERCSKDNYSFILIDNI